MDRGCSAGFQPFPTCCIADFQSAHRPNLRAHEMMCGMQARSPAIQQVGNRLETCATTLSTALHAPKKGCNCLQDMGFSGYLRVGCFAGGFLPAGTLAG